MAWVAGGVWRSQAVAGGRQVTASDTSKRHLHLGSSEGLPRAVSCVGVEREKKPGLSPPWEEFKEWRARLRRRRKKIKKKES